MIRTTWTSGVKINDWTLIEYDPNKKPGIYWFCKCKCGNISSNQPSSLKLGNSKCCRSCSVKKRPPPKGLKKSLNLIGKKFGSWTVLKRIENIDNKSIWECSCVCGLIKKIQGSSLVSGGTLSCIKCAKHDGKVTHGYCRKNKIPEYHIWNSIKNRCLNKNDKGYVNYGGRGIHLCDKWKNSFEDFLNDVGKKPFPGASLDRINNDGNYEPENIRWTDRQTQASNTRSQRFGFSVKRWSRENNCCRFEVTKLLENGLSKQEILLVKKYPYRGY